MLTVLRRKLRCFDKTLLLCGSNAFMITLQIIIETVVKFNLVTFYSLTEQNEMAARIIHNQPFTE